jgi:acetyltransferase
MARTKIYEALRGVRGRAPSDLAGLEQLLVRFSWLVVEQRWIRELDINPLIIGYEPGPDGAPPPMLALDARVVVYGQEVTEAELPELAIRPYPTQYVSRWTSRKGAELVIRPIRPEDEPAMVEFHNGLSDRSVYLRYLHPMQLTARVQHERLARLCFIDYAREMALVAVEPAAGDGAHEPRILGVGRLSRTAGNEAESEFAILVTDAYQGHGIGYELLRRLVENGKAEGQKRIIGYISTENDSMQNIARKLGFTLRRLKQDDVVEARLDLA